MTKKPSYDRVIIIGTVDRVRVNRKGEEPPSLMHVNVVTYRLQQSGESLVTAPSVHWITLWGVKNVANAEKEIKPGLQIVVEAHLKYRSLIHDLADGRSVKVRITDLVADYYDIIGGEPNGEAPEAMAKDIQSRLAESATDVSDTVMESRGRAARGDHA